MRVWYGGVGHQRGSCCRPAPLSPPHTPPHTHAAQLGDNEEVCYCLKAWQELPEPLRKGQRAGKDDALKVCGGWGGGVGRGRGGGDAEAGRACALLPRTAPPPPCHTNRV